MGCKYRTSIPINKSYSFILFIVSQLQIDHELSFSADLTSIQSVQPVAKPQADYKVSNTIWLQSSLMYILQVCSIQNRFK